MVSNFTSLCKFLPPCFTSSLKGQNVFLNTLSLFSSLHVRDHVSYPYKTTGKTVILNFLMAVFLVIKQNTNDSVLVACIPQISLLFLHECFCSVSVIPRHLKFFKFLGGEKKLLAFLMLWFQPTFCWHWMRAIESQFKVYNLKILLHWRFMFSWSQPQTQIKYI